MNLTRLGARQRQQLVDQARQLVELFDLTGERALPARRRPIGPQRQLDLAAQRGQRRAQLVCERGAELPHLADGVLQPRQRLVERAAPRRRARRRRRGAAGAARSVATSMSRAASAQRDSGAQGKARQPPRRRAAATQRARRQQPQQQIAIAAQRRVHRASDTPTCSRYVRPGRPRDHAVGDAHAAVLGA